jgi:aspartate aminotransferase
MKAILSEHFQHREPSGIRLAQIEFMKRGEAVEAVNVAIGNVSLPMHPAMIRRLTALGAPDSPFRDGVVKYTPTVGLEETRAAFLNVIASSGFPAQGLHAQITDGGSQAMELILLGVCGPAGSGKRPLLVIDPTYTNYGAMAGRTGRATVSMTRTLGADGRFTLPSLEEIERLIRRHKPGALLVIPYDNPTGQLCSQEQLRELASLCVKHNLWLASDEAYRELFYTGGRAVSVWGLSDREVPGIEGRRIGLESTSKVWNACGLRIGALVTDNEEFHRRAVAENTANLCAIAIGQYIFGALAHEGRSELSAWYERQREYYRGLLARITGDPASCPG